MTGDGALFSFNGAWNLCYLCGLITSCYRHYLEGKSFSPPSLPDHPPAIDLFHRYRVQRFALGGAGDALAAVETEAGLVVGTDQQLAVAAEDVAAAAVQRQVLMGAGVDVGVHPAIGVAGEDQREAAVVALDIEAAALTRGQAGRFQHGGPGRWCALVLAPGVGHRGIS